MSILNQTLETVAFVLCAGLLAFYLAIYCLGWEQHEAIWCVLWSPFAAWLRVALHRD